MRDGQASVTALGIALIRAHETARRGADRIFEDPLAKHFAAPLLHQLFRGFALLAPSGINFLVARERYGDEVLERELAQGITQLVILGAGYDARAVRYQEALKKVEIFEVDHPATQARKRDKLATLPSGLPRHVRFVPVDFRTQSLRERLAASGYRSDARTLFLWQGVTPYLTLPEIDATLAFVTGHAAKGSTLVFDYVISRFIAGPQLRVEFRLMSLLRAISQERIQFGLEVDEVEPFLTARGFMQIENLTHSALHARYFRGAAAGREVTDVCGIVSAKVG